MRKRDQLSLNGDHTHFIIIRKPSSKPNSMNSSEKKIEHKDTSEKLLEELTDSATCSTNKFRDAFEALLHRPRSQLQTTTASETQLPPTTLTGRNSLVTTSTGSPIIVKGTKNMST